MADQTQYFDFNAAKDPFQGLSADALASLVPQIPGQLRIDILTEEATVGRTDATDIVIAHRNVSKNHSRLRRDGSMWEIEDIGSTNGTFVNGQKISSAVLISHKDVIGFGDQTYEFVIHEQRAKEEPAMPKAETGESPSMPASSGGGMTAMFGSLFEPSAQQGGGSRPSAPSSSGGMSFGSSSSQGGMAASPSESGGDNKTMLRSYDFSEVANQKKVYATLIEKSLQSSRISLTALRNRVGSAITNEVRINDPSVRAEHAELTFERDGRVKVRVLATDVVIKVNNEPVKAQYLNDLDTVQFGEIIYTFKIEQMPDDEDFEADSVHRAASSGGKGKLVAFAVVLLVVGGGAAFMFLGGGTGGIPIVAPPAAPTPTPIQNVASELELIKANFEKGKLVEARDQIAELDASKPEVAELKKAINVLIDAQAALNGRDVLAAAKQMALLKGSAFENDSRVEKLRQSVEYEQKHEADDSYDRAEREFRAARFGDAQRYFQRADDFMPGYKDARAQAVGAGLAQNAADALKSAEATIVSRDYAAAEGVLEKSLAEIDAKRAQAAGGDILAKQQGKLNDYLHFSRMKRLYLEGDAKGALEAYANIGEELRVAQRVDPFAQKIGEVSQLAQEAAAESSLAKADRVLQLETDESNYYHIEAKKIVAELSAVQREKAQSFFDQAVEDNKRDDLIRGIQNIWRARQLDPSWEEARRLHDETGSKLLVQAYRLPSSGEFLEQKKSIYRLIMENAEAEDKIYMQAERQLKQILP